MDPLFRHILIPIDGSEASLAAVQMALRFVRVCPACRITGLYVIDKLVLSELIRFHSGQPGEVRVELEKEGRKYLELAQTEVENAGGSMNLQTREGDPFEEIISLTNQLHADLILMGHTGRRGTARVLIGSVTQRVLDYAPCPVLVTRG